MPSFEYTAINAHGNAETGTVLGLSLTDAAQQLAEKGLKVERINLSQFLGDPLSAVPAPPPTTTTATVESPKSEFDQGGPPGESPYSTEKQAEIPAPPPAEARSYFATSVAGPLVGRVSLNNLMFFFRQFGTMIEAGVPIVQSLETLAGQATDPRMAHVIREMKGHVLAGRPISAGMQRYPEVFSPLHMSLIRAGEEGGYVALACKQVAEYIEQEIRIRNLYKRSLFMPKMTVISSILIIAAANWIIATYTKGQGIWSPLTQISTWIILGPILIGLFLFFRVGLANPRIRYSWDAFIIKIPYLGNTLQQFAMAKFGRAFGTLYAGGVSIPKSIQLAADACGNEYLRAQIHPASKQLETGDAITETLRSTRAFTPIVMDMMYTGEATGNLDSMLTKVSDFYEDEAEVRSQQLGKVVGVVAIVAVGIYVLIVLVKFYSGYFNALLNSANGD
ncbi:MAG: type II secretion system F family protein [Fimbriimonadaceae bacterium]|nr:type II secretion system F family protein [Fimbriimonadaceae bacterium]